MKFNQIINNFSAGEWSPKMRGRTDAQQYANACEIMKNFLPQVQGGAFRRPPTRFVNLPADQYTDLQTAVSNTIVKSKIIPQALSSSGTYNVIFAFDGVPSTTWFLLGSTVPDAGALTLTVSSGADYTDSASNIKYCQVGDIIFLAQGSTGAGYAPRVIYPGAGYQMKLLREYLSSENWKSVPYLEVQANDSSVTLTASAATGSITLTASAAFFNSGHVGAFFKLSAGGSTGVVRVTAFTNSTTVTATVLSTVTTSAVGSTSGTSWEESAWSDYRGWPRTVTAFQGRLIFGGSTSYPDTIWGSRISNVFDFMERPFEQDSFFSSYTSDNSRPFTLTPNSKEASTIRALSSAKTLLIHTDRSEIVGYGTQGAMGPNDVTFESSTSFGANSPMPSRANNYSVFVEKGGRKLRDVIFSFNEDQYKSTDLSFVSDHLTVDPTVPEIDPIVEIQGFSQLSSYIFAKTQNGRLLSLTLDRDYQINAWSSIELGGSSELKDYPLVKSIGVIQTTSELDRIYMIVQRRVNGVNVAYIEYMDAPKETSNVLPTASDFFYADAMNGNDYRTWDASVLNRIYSLDHLKGETVAVVADGEYLGEFEVTTTGELPATVDWSQYTTIRAGLPYESKLKPMPVELGQQVPGTPQGFLKRIDEVTIKFWNSRGAKYGTKDSAMTAIDFKDPSVAMDDPPVLFSGYKKLKLESNYSVEAQVQIVQDTPWPCNVLAVISRGVTYD